MALFDLFWSMLWFFMFIIWIWLLITIFADIFRNKEMNGCVKAIWILFVIILPLLGVLSYLILPCKCLQERAMATAAAQAKMNRDYIQEVSGSGSSADEIAKLADLKDKGVLTDEEFAAQKAKLLG